MEVFIMPLKNNQLNLINLHNIITEYYFKLGRDFLIYENKNVDDINSNDYYVRWLLDKKRVFEYRITRDRGIDLSIVSMAIGPHFFSVHDFWDYTNGERFRLSIDRESILANLILLDEFIEKDD